MPDEERVRTKRRKLDSIITKLHHATPPGRENLEEETKPDEAAQENVNADEGKETRPRLSRRKLHVAVKQKEVSDVLNVEASPEDKAQEQLSDNGVMEDEAWANSTKEDAENLICNGERGTGEKIEPECSTKDKTGPLESVDNTEDGFQKGLSEEAEKEDTQGGEIKRKRLHSEGSEADGGDYQAKVFVLDEELFANVVHPQSNADDSTELQSEKPAAKQNDQVEKLKSSINSLSVNSISHDEQSHNDQSTNLDESSTTCKQSTEESGVLLTMGEKNSAVENLRDELLRSCVSPTKIELVQETLESENERHLCALKLLSCLFSKEELASSNTDGSYDKKCLDSQRLHLLKVLVFNKFPAPSGIEKDKEWKTIKGKINSKCRVARYSAKFVLMDEQLAANNGHSQESPVPDIFAKRKQRQKELKAKCKPERAKLNLSIDDQHSKDETTACTPDDDCDGERDSTCTSELLKQLDAKTDECERLRAKLHDSEEALRRQTNLQASAFEMLKTIKTCVVELESKMAAGFQRIEERLNGLEQASVNAPTLLHGTISALCQNGMGQEIAQASNLQTTIDLKELKTTPQPTGGSCVPLTSVERKHCFQNVSHELICSHVSPAKVKLVQETLEKESERHLCALKLLSCLFSKKELAISSTSGSNNKKSLDSQRLNSIKVLLFSRFPASSSVEREKEWKAIKQLPRRVDCTACGRQINPAHGTICQHPCLNVLVCKKCNQYYNSGPFTRDELGIDEQCRWCGDGGSLLCCDKCDKAFCKPCIKRNLGKITLREIVSAPEGVEWLCFSCNPKPLSKLIRACNRIMKIVQTRKAQKTIFKTKKGPLLTDTPNQKERRNRLSSLTENLGMNSDGALSPSESQTKKNVAGTSEDDSDFVQNKTEEAKYRKQNGSLKDVITIQDESDSDDFVNSDKVSEKKTAKGKANRGMKRNMEKTVKKRDYNSRPQRSKQNDKKVKNRIDSDICLDKRKSKVKSANKKGKNKMLSVKTSKGGQGSGSESDLSDFISMVNTTNRQAKKHGGRQRKDKAQGYLISTSEEEDEESSVDEDEESSEDEDVDSEKDKRTRRSRKSSVSQKQTRKRRRKVTSSENDSEFSENQSGSDTPDKKGKQSQKRRRKEKVALESDEEDDSDDNDKEIGSKNKRKLSRKCKKSDSESEKDKKNVNKKGKGKTKGKKKGGKKKKKHYIEKDSGESEEVDEEEEVSPSKRKGRKKIRKLIKDEKLTEETKRARKLEEERRKRLLERTRNNEDDMPGETAKVHKLVLESDPTTKESIVEVKEDLLQYLKPHQCRGIQFMYDCVIESVNSWKKDEPGGGCILAHCMGLGKTLQVVGLVHTLMTHKEINMQRVMVVSPLNTVLNWQVEFDKWLSVDDRLEVLILQDVSGDNWRRADMLNHWFKYGGVLILGYSMYRNLSQCFRVRSKNQKKIFQEALVNPGPDLVICDEGHILRNDATAISKALNGIKTRRRIVLTGTPLQNNLIEYHCMVSFVKPSLLGTRKEYTNTFVNPIQNGQCADSTAMDVQLMKQRCHVLHKMLEGCVQRMDYSVLIPFLPRKHEYVIKVRLSILQRTLYHHFLSTFVYPEGTLGKKGVSLFSDYQALMRIWTHPWCLKLEALRRPEKFVDSDSMDDFVVHTDEEEEDQENEDEEQMEWESSSEEEVQFSSESDEDSKRKQRRRRRGKESSSDEEEDEEEEEEEEVEDESDGDSEDEEVVLQPSKSSKRTNASTVNIDGEEITVVNINSRAGTSGRKLRDKDPQSGKRDTEERKGKATTKSESKGSSNSGSDSALCSSSAFGSTRSGTAFKDVEDVEIEDEKEWYDEFLTEADELNEQLSGKLVLLMEILADAEAVEDKVLVFSQSLVTLDLIEKMLGGGEIGGDRENWCRGCDYFRMDGSTSAAMRQRWADIFNDEDNKNARLFLISTKAGGLGINLVAANRVIVFDVSWNPSHDVQSIFRVYRFGQSKPVFVYRFIAQGTMEEKIYDRQVTKLAISGRVVDEQQIERHFNAADLSELYTFNPELLEEDKVAAAGKNQQDAMDTEAENGNEAISGRGIGKDEKSEKEGRNVKESGDAEKCEISAGNSGTSNQTGTETKTPEAPKMPLPKDAVLADLINRLHPKWIVNYHEHDSLLQNIESEKLTEDEMKAAWEAYEAEKSGKTVFGPVQDSLMPDHAQTQQHVAERIRLNSEMLQQIQQIRQLQEMQQRQEVEERMRRVRQQREQIYQRQREVLIQEHRRQQDEMRRQNQMRFIHHMTQPGATPQLQLGQNTINVQTQLPNVAAPRHAPPPPYLSIQVPTAVPIGLRLPSSVGPPLPVTPPAASNPTNR